MLVLLPLVPDVVPLSNVYPSLLSLIQSSQQYPLPLPESHAQASKPASGLIPLVPLRVTCALITGAKLARDYKTREKAPPNEPGPLAPRPSHPVR